MFMLSRTAHGKMNIGGSGLSADALAKIADRVHFSGNEAPDDLADESLLLEVPERFEMEEPFHLMFMTMREDQDASSMVLMQASPEGMLYLSETVPGQSLQFLNRRNLHRHDFYELLYVIEGDIYQNIEHSRHYYPEGSCCLLNPNVYHSEESYGNQRIVFLGLRQDFLQKIVNAAHFFPEEDAEAFRNLLAFLKLQDPGSEFSGKASMDFIPLESDQWVRENMHDVFERILWIMKQPEAGASLQISALILRMLCLLFDPAHYRHSPVQFASGREELLFREITDYLRLHHGKPRRSELAARFHYSGDYLYKTVRKFTGLSLSDYASKITLDLAAHLLRTSTLPITELIRSLGYTNQTFFYRQFRETYGMSPREYRQQLTT